jgi:hypothetical protein
VDLLLSVDGGNSFDQVATNLFAGPDGSNGLHVLRVPNTPSRFCVVKVEREAPFSESVSDTFFTIEADVALLNFVISFNPAGGNLVTWMTDPSPEDLAGYRLDRAAPGAAWQTLVQLTKETRFVDASGRARDRYRLYAVNGMGQEFLMGEASGDAPAAQPGSLSAWPQPFSAGELSIGFDTFGALGSPTADVTMDIYDVQGRLVRRLVNDTFPAGTHVVKWDGRTALGAEAATGVYFVVSQSGPVRASRKIVIVR